MEKKIVKPYKALNPYKGGICRTIKSQYWKNGIDNFTCQGSYGATGVIRKIEKRDSNSWSNRKNGKAES